VLAGSGFLFVAFALAGFVLIRQAVPPQRPLLVVFLFSMFLQCVAALLAGNKPKVHTVARRVPEHVGLNVTMAEDAPAGAVVCSTQARRRAALL
jgi:hypothetical protein